MANENKNCEKCFSPYLDDRKKIIYQGMEFCDINCFINSRHFDIENLDIVKDMREEYDDLNDDFKNSEDTKTTLETLNKVAVDKIEELIEKYDPEFETGNKELDEVLLAIMDVQRELRYDD